MTGCCPVSCSNTLDALVSLSPDSPTQMFRHSFMIRNSRITLFFCLSLEPCSWKLTKIILTVVWNKASIQEHLNLMEPTNVRSNSMCSSWLISLHDQQRAGIYTNYRQPDFAIRVVLMCHNYSQSWKWQGFLIYIYVFKNMFKPSPSFWPVP